MVMMDVMRHALAHCGEYRHCAMCSLRYFMGAAQRGSFLSKGLKAPKKCQPCLDVLRAKRDDPDWK